MGVFSTRQSPDHHPQNPGGQQQPPGTAESLSKQNNGKLALVPTPSDDPDDPLTWPMWRKCVNFGLLSEMTISIFTGISIDHIFWPQMKKDLQVEFEDLTNAKPTQLAAEAISCIVFIPFAQKYGRRPVYLVSTALYTIATWWICWRSQRDSRSDERTYIAHVRVNALRSARQIRDLFFVHQRGSANGLYVASVSFGGFLSPVAAEIQAKASGWRASYTTLAYCVTALTALFAFGFEETKFVPKHRHGSISETRKKARAQIIEEIDPKEKAADPPYPLQAPIPVSRPQATRPPFLHFLKLQLLTPTNESFLQTFYHPVFVIWLPYGLPWIYPCIGGTIASFGFIAISDMVFTLVIDSYPNVVAQAFVVVTFSRNAIGMIGTFAFTPWRQSMSITAMFIVAGITSLTINLIALPIAFWGKRSRVASADRYHRMASQVKQGSRREKESTGGLGCRRTLRMI
ncbi:major facilitator superfamily protein [Hirsutella rhossiliensis]|uniref:Major facilitator superfamily domain-containing protein n=1 Tax=Hirsutella rhossiliensis TaxID=111463 RepID=A0A9P8SP46_9HYPO|nr:major facilitator superfamily domain-containing protein [Hirsutella rhossiliensis]KAH0968555.1 major facilitator superfamily domain-containing protein [Hirsutella rhossiliensis]